MVTCHLSQGSGFHFWILLLFAEHLDQLGRFEVEVFGRVTKRRICLARIKGAVSTSIHANLSNEDSHLLFSGKGMDQLNRFPAKIVLLGI